MISIIAQKLKSSREQLYANATQYKEYLKKMDENPDMNLHYRGSIQYRNSPTLLGASIDQERGTNGTKSCCLHVRSILRKVHCFQ